MAMRRTAGYNYPRRAVVIPIYETLHPKTEMKEQDDTLLLLVHLPGFLIEQIRFSIDDTSRHLKVYGERSLENKRRVQFNTAFIIPPDYSLSQLTTRFSLGILKLSFPKTPNHQQIPNPNDFLNDHSHNHNQQPETSTPTTRAGSTAVKDKNEDTNHGGEDNDKILADDNGFEERKQLLVNMSAAVGVIVAFGATMFYNMLCSCNH